MYDTNLAQEGAQFLDEVNPGWWTKIDKDRLGMASSKNCIIGQLYGNNVEGERKLGIADQVTKLGFHIPVYNILWLLTLQNPWHKLSKAWKQEIADRQAQETTCPYSRASHTEEAHLSEEVPQELPLLFTSPLNSILFRVVP